MRWKFITTGLLLVLCQFPALSAPKKAKEQPHVKIETFTITGTMTVYEGSFTRDHIGVFVEGDSCFGRKGYSDISTGAQVVVRDAEDKIIGMGKLGAGTLSKDPSIWECNFPFIVENLSKSPFYSVEISHRGRLVYSVDDLVKNGWKVNTSLGL